MVFELLVIISVSLLIILLLWVKANVRFSDNCPKCGSNLNVKRVPRSFLVKYLLFVFNTRRLRCDKCWKFFYQVFPTNQTSS